MPFYGCRQTFSDLFDNLDCTIACLEQINAGRKVIQVKRLVTTSVCVGFDRAAAKIIDSICAGFVSYPVILPICDKLKLICFRYSAAYGRTV